MKARRLVAALAGFLLFAPPALRAGTSCDAAKSQMTQMSSAMHHSVPADQPGDDAHLPPKSCDSHDSDCCTFTGACGITAFVANRPVSSAPAAEPQAMVFADAAFKSAPLASLDPPPPRA